MLANYHTHTYRCHHARGTEREYIERAIEFGMPVLGFSDHVPYPFPQGYHSWFRMDLGELDDYVGTLAALRDEYRQDIQILIGFEAEYYPDYFNQLIGDLDAYDYDYLLLGQHFLENECSGIYCGTPTNLERILKMYVDQTIAGMQTGKFTYLAHPDLINYTGDPEKYRQHMTRLCVAAKAMAMPLEINFLGITDHRHYPCGPFFEIVSQVGNQVVLGCDAHQPSAVYDPGAITLSEAFIRKYRLQMIDHLQIINPKR